MKKRGWALLVIILFLNSVPIDCSASIAADADQPTTLELAEIFNHVFIVKVTSKIETTYRTFYVFNVTECLKAPVNSSTLSFTAYGGSEIRVSPTTTFYTGLDYLFFCDEINEEYSITGNHHNYKLLDSVNPTEIEEIRRTLMALKAATIEHTVPTLEIAITDRELEQPVEPNINPPRKEMNLDPETVKEIRVQNNMLLTVVYICVAGIYARAKRVNR